MPEVEQVRKSLSPHIIGKKILAVSSYLDRLIKYPAPEIFCRALTGRTFTAVERRGKYLLLRTDAEQQLVVHLRMTGALLALPTSVPEPPYAKIKFTLSEETTLWFTDIRTFGTLYLVTGNDYTIEGLATLGPEPLSAELTADYLEPLARKGRKPVKSFILDQRIIAGLGNIYADESLALAGILPQRLTGTLTRAELERLCAAINTVIAQGIRNHGTTFRNYQDSDGNSGSNQEHLLVYGRGGEPCRSCGRPLCKTKVGGRGTVYCEQCQK